MQDKLIIPLDLLEDPNHFTLVDLNNLLIESDKEDFKVKSLHLPEKYYDSLDKIECNITYSRHPETKEEIDFKETMDRLVGVKKWEVYTEIQILKTSDNEIYCL